MLRFLTITALVLVALTSQALPGKQLNLPDAPPNGAPIDGGASLLLAGGAGYILRRLKKRRQARA